ncbi:uncharacterized protein F4812DRAFT_360738 [Daldinia caldariorum]|uniref:uncharacterized protein n=1 Tax=Daldinia caldariorum TaxID=326644 RepID=UPI002008D51C|nr:uncharacterized protein F4812DRAFT_360738 [Daldinia caldariorum]KAI1468276.1 hypothetical protein F4812DRAFT_360738 [Daldinia caldariorum]
MRDAWCTRSLSLCVLYLLYKQTRYAVQYKLNNTIQYCSKNRLRVALILVSLTSFHRYLTASSARDSRGNVHTILFSKSKGTLSTWYSPVQPVPSVLKKKN